MEKKYLRSFGLQDNQMTEVSAVWSLVIELVHKKNGMTETALIKTISFVSLFNDCKYAETLLIKTIFEYKLQIFSSAPKENSLTVVSLIPISTTFFFSFFNFPRLYFCYEFCFKIEHTLFTSYRIYNLISDEPINLDNYSRYEKKILFDNQTHDTD